MEDDLHASEQLATLEKLEMFLPDNAARMRRTLAHMFVVALAERGDKTHLKWLRAPMAEDFNLCQ